MGLILGLIAAIAVSAISKLITDEAKAWSPRFARFLVKRAVMQLPEEQRDRYQEEWTAFIEETPGDITKIARAFGLTAAANSICAYVWEGKVPDLGDRANDAAKRVFDIAFSVLTLTVLAPLLLLIALAIKCDSGGPIFSADGVAVATPESSTRCRFGQCANQSIFPLES